MNLPFVAPQEVSFCIFELPQLTGEENHIKQMNCFVFPYYPLRYRIYFLSIKTAVFLVM